MGGSSHVAMGRGRCDGQKKVREHERKDLRLPSPRSRDAFPTLSLQQQSTNHQHQRPSDLLPNQIHSTKSPDRTFRDVEPSTCTAVVTPQHRALPKAATAFPPASAIGTTDSEYGGPREPDEDDCGSGTRHAWPRRIFRCHVSSVAVGTIQCALCSHMSDADSRCSGSWLQARF